MKMAREPVLHFRLVRAMFDIRGVMITLEVTSIDGLRYKVDLRPGDTMVASSEVVEPEVIVGAETKQLLMEF